MNWTKARLGEIGKFYSGLSGKTAADFGSGRPFISYNSVFGSSRCFIAGQPLVRLEQGERQNTVSNGDIILTGSSETAEEVAMSSLYCDQAPACLNSFCIGYSYDHQRLMPCYAEYFFRGQEFRRSVFPLAQGSTRFNISREELTRVVITLPPLAEQRKIAEILQIWDEAIETAEAERKAKQERKRWLMNKLLAPALAHGQQGWRSVELGDCFSERSERGQPGLPLLSITGEYGVVDRELIGRRDTSAADKGKYLRIYPGDIGYNTMRMWQGVCGLSNQDGIVSPAYTILRPLPGTNAAFMYYLFKYPAMIAKFHSRSQGLVKDTLNLKFPAFSKISVNQPDANVQ
jgi:type I restriction enzyme S subunit